MKSMYDHQPPKWDAVGNGSYRYCWNIHEVEITEEEQTRTQWECDEAIVWSPITSNKITAAVISELWDNDYEQKLVNEYNAALLGVYDEEAAEKKIANYKAFLVERDAVKKQVDADCEELGIR